MARLENSVAELQDVLADTGERLSPQAASDDRAVYYANAREWVRAALRRDLHPAARRGVALVRPLGGAPRRPAPGSRRCGGPGSTLRTDPVTGIAVWYRDHLDHHLPILLSTRGPFASCTPTRHEAPVPLPTAPSSDPPGESAAPADESPTSATTRISISDRRAS